MIKYLKATLSLITVLGIASIMGCPSGPVIVNPHVPTEEDISYCKPGCDHLMTLIGRDSQRGCEESRPLVYPDGTVESCEQFCTEAQQEGRFLNPKCWMTLASCLDIETVCRR